MDTPKFMFLDIETLPKGEKETVQYPPMPTMNDVKVGNRKDETAQTYREEQLPKLIEKHNDECAVLDAKANENFKKKALISMEAEILCLGYAFDDQPVEILTGSEKSIIITFDRVLEDFGDKRHAITFVGHNIREFDLKLIYHRAFKYKVDNLKKHLSYLDRNNIYDTMEKWGFLSYRDYQGLDNILKYLGIGGKGDIDGSMIYDLYEAGELFRIYDYCKKDVEQTRKLFKVLYK